MPRYGHTRPYLVERAAAGNRHKQLPRRRQTLHIARSQLVESSGAGVPQAAILVSATLATGPGTRAIGSGCAADGIAIKGFGAQFLQARHRAIGMDQRDSTLGHAGG